MKCATGKRGYPSMDEARNALLEAHVRYEYGRGKAPVNAYVCDECGQYHLTSKGEMDAALAESLAQGKIHQQKTARQWLDRIHKRR